MALSTDERSKTLNHPVCPHCRRTIEIACRSSIVENGLSVVAGLVLVLMLMPLAVIAWKSCSDFLSDKISHSILYHPLEDWSRF
ncbi:MAG: hypothetical protein ABSF28_21155 [Terracidiphilus sp.]